jgi:hypothetical protein
MTRPAATRLADDLHEGVGAWNQLDEQNAWSALHVCVAVARGGDLVDQIVTPSLEERGPWETVLDIDHVPAELLPWLAQWVGVDPASLVGLSEADQRQMIRDTSAQRRGTPDALVGAGRPSLTGTQLVTLRERDGGAYRFTIITYEAQTPNPSETGRRFVSQKAAGLLMTYRVDPGWSIGEFEDFFAAQTIDDAETAFTTLGDLESNLPT